MLQKWITFNSRAPKARRSAHAHGMHVGRIIRDLRERRALTQAMVADRAGISLATMNRLEATATLKIRPDLLVAVLSALRARGEIDTATVGQLAQATRLDPEALHVGLHEGRHFRYGRSSSA